MYLHLLQISAKLKNSSQVSQWEWNPFSTLFRLIVFWWKNKKTVCFSFVLLNFNFDLCHTGCVRVSLLRCTHKQKWHTILLWIIFQKFESEKNRKKLFASNGWGKMKKILNFIRRPFTRTHTRTCNPISRYFYVFYQFKTTNSNTETAFPRNSENSYSLWYSLSVATSWRIARRNDPETLSMRSHEFIPKKHSTSA